VTDYQTRLSNIFAKLETLVGDGEGQRERQREFELMERRERSAARMTRVRHERIPLEPSVREALVWGKPLKPTTALTATKKWLANPKAPPTLVLVGGTGCGKSVAAAFASLYAMHRTVKWRSANALVRAFAQLYGDGPAQQQQCFDCDLLVMEDVGTESDASRLESAMIELLEARGKDPDRRVLITTNLTQAALFQAYPDERLHSRLSPRLAAWVYCTGDDMRKGDPA
jgi:DNA replication protein DnaC